MRLRWQLAALCVAAALPACSIETAGFREPVCGNGVVEAGEGCDDGNTIADACPYGATSCMVCDATCQPVAGAASYCGDSSVDPAFEACDDGNGKSWDGCGYRLHGELARVPQGVQHAGVRLLRLQPRAVGRWLDPGRGPSTRTARRGASTATRPKTVELAPDYRVAYGEMVVLGGDFFGSIAEVRKLAAIPGKGAGRARRSITSAA